MNNVLNRSKQSCVLLRLTLASILAVSIILGSASGTHDVNYSSSPEEVILTPGLSFAVETYSGISSRLEGLSIREESLLRQSSYNYKVVSGDREIGRITLTCQDLRHGALLFYVESRNLTANNHMCQGRLTLLGPHPTEGKTLVYPDGKRVVGQSTWDYISPTQLISQLPPGIAFLDGEAKSMVFGPVDQFRYMGNGVYQEVNTFPISVGRDPDRSEFSFPLADTREGIIRFWGIIHNKQLVAWEDEALVSSIQRADLNKTRKFWLDGVYDLVPSTYQPTHPLAFWRCPAQHVGRLFLTKTSPFTYAIAVSSMYSAIRTQNRSGYWPTEPQSEWLAEEYGFGPNFYDTRFNTDVAQYLLEAYQEYGDETALNAARRYADFLCRFANQHAYRSKNGGYLVPDYQAATGEHRTHTSLNHLLAEMNFLYYMYLATDEVEYRDTADMMLLAVKDTCDEWIKESGELWYARLPNGDYGYQDYPTLTLNDLRQSQDIITRISGDPDPDLARLISSKEAYNRANGIPLW